MRKHLMRPDGSGAGWVNVTLSWWRRPLARWIQTATLGEMLREYKRIEKQERRTS